jgi:hypothetical protein
MAVDTTRSYNLATDDEDFIESEPWWEDDEEEYSEEEIFEEEELESDKYDPQGGDFYV